MSTILDALRKAQGKDRGRGADQRADGEAQSAESASEPSVENDEAAPSRPSLRSILLVAAIGLALGGGGAWLASDRQEPASEVDMDLLAKPPVRRKLTGAGARVRVGKGEAPAASATAELPRVAPLPPIEPLVPPPAAEPSIPVAPALEPPAEPSIPAVAALEAPADEAPAIEAAEEPIPTLPVEPAAPPVAASPPPITPPAEPAAQPELLDAPPPEAPTPGLLFIQWVREPERRIASLRTSAGQLVIVHEGDTVEGLLVKTIRPDSIEFHWRGTRFLLLASR